MPIYEYRCDACGHTVEAFQKFADEPLEACEVCGGHLTKVLHPVAIHFKGSGFYTTDYGRGSSKRPAGEAGKSRDGDASEGGATKASGDGKADGGKAGDGKADGGKAGGGAAQGDGAGGAAARSSAGKGG